MATIKYFFTLLTLFISFSLSAQFTEEQVLSTTPGASRDVVTADLDEDGALDVLVGANRSLYWQRNIEGTGLFEPPTILDEGDFDFKDVYAEDLDGDGDQDVLATAQQAAWIAYYENMGDGTFGERNILFEDGAYAAAVHAADIDNDGKMDIVTGSRTTSPGPGVRWRWFKNNGDLNFSAPIIISYFGSSTLRTTANSADLNGDEFVDLILTDANFDRVQLFMNDGDGTFTSSSLTPSDSNVRIHDTAIADLDKDDDLDIFYADFYTAKTYFANNGDGTFSEVSLPDFVGGIDADVLDYDLDGDMDVVTVVFGDGFSQAGGMNILTNDGTGIFTKEFTAFAEGIESQRVAIGDLNKDGFDDVVNVTGSTSSFDNQQVVWYENNLGADFLPVQSISASGKDIYEIGFYDFDLDQILDMYIVSLSDQKITWLEGKGGKEFGAVHTVGYLNGGLGKTVFVDFDQDGDHDFISTDQTEAEGTNTNGNLYLFVNNGQGDFSEEILFPGLSTAEDIEFMQFADLDQDDDLDLVIYQSSTPQGKVSLVENMGNGNYAAPVELISSTIPVSTFKLIDIDEDGWIDLLYSEVAATGRIRWQKNLGGNSFENANTLLSTNNVDLFDFKLVDLDYDADLDLVAALQASFSNSGELLIYKNNGNNDFELFETILATTSFLFANGLQFDFGDIDVDGDLDILYGHDGLYYNRQAADGSFSEKITLVDSFDGKEVKLQDFNNDGDLDALFVYFVFFGDTEMERISLLENYANNASLRGFVYNDENSNGNYDAMEAKISNQQVDISPAAIATFTSDEGDYTFYVDEGNYVITPILDECWTLSTTPIVYNVSTNGIDVEDGLNFGASLNSSAAEVDIQMISAPTRCGFTVPFWMTMTNDGCVAAAGYGELVLSELASLQDVVPAPDEMIGDTLRWNYINLLPGEKLEVLLEFEIADASNIGEFIEIPLSTFNQVTGNTELNHEFLFSSEINCAYDPNDKQVYPKRTELNYDEDYVIPNELLLYTIRFQNTGTDTAFNIVIRDQLSADLDWTTFEPATASHPFESTLHDDGLLEFHFRDILLVDSLTNEPGSHGFVNFRIQPMSGLAENTIIENNAGIYFDFNPPIITNTVENIFVLELPMLLLPVANFSVTINELAASFTNLSTNDPLTSFWTFGDGASSTEFSPMHTYAEDGEYEVCLTVSNDDGEDTFCQTIEVIISSAQTLSETIDYVLMPNPAHDQVSMVFEKRLPEGLSFGMYTVAGQRVAVEIGVQEKRADFDVSMLPKGMYFLEGKVAGEILVREYLVVQ